MAEAVPRLLLALALGSAACTVEFDNSGPIAEGGLAFNHITAKGTHNSYHLAPTPPGDPELAFSHLPLDEQAATQGIRQFELDLHHDAPGGRFEVFHEGIVDEGTTCLLFVDCLAALKAWSDANPTHHPMMVIIDLKDPFSSALAGGLLDTFDAEVSSVWPTDRLITPDRVRGDDLSLRTALTDRGWPTIDELRQKVMFFILDQTGYDLEYSFGGASLVGRLAFVQATSPTAPYAAVAKADALDPLIEQQINLNIMVRARVDVVELTGPVLDPRRLDAALAAGVHFVSTDVPTSLELPGGTPSICNQVTAPATCESLLIESLP